VCKTKKNLFGGSVFVVVTVCYDRSFTTERYLSIAFLMRPRGLNSSPIQEILWHFYRLRKVSCSRHVFHGQIISSRWGHTCGMCSAQSRFHPYVEIIDSNTVEGTDVA